MQMGRPPIEEVVDLELEPEGEAWAIAPGVAQLQRRHVVGCASLARKFHTLLAGGATECSEDYYVVESRRDFRADDKTASPFDKLRAPSLSRGRFCFSPHDLEMGGGVMKQQRSKDV
jgi:hypothetical protein